MANKSIKQLEKEKNRSFFILAAFALAIGIALFFTGGDAKWVSIVFFAAAAALVAAGIIGIKKGPKYDDPGSPAALRHTQAMKVKADKIRERAHSHNSLSDESSMRPMIISGVVFGVLALLNLGIWFFTGYIYIWLIIALVITLVMFIIFLMSKDHKKLLKQFEAYGYDEAGAEEIFKDMALIRGGGFNAIGREFFITDTKNGRLLLKTEELVWAFIRKQWVYNYTNGIYTGRSDNFYVIYLSNDGGYMESKASEAACMAVIDELCDIIPGFTAGYSKEISDIYSEDPASFKGKALPYVDRYSMLQPTPEDE